MWVNIVVWFFALVEHSALFVTIFILHMTSKSINVRVILRAIHIALSQRALLQPQERMLAALSGGQDSVGMITLLSRLQLLWHWKLAVVHCDHQWHASSRFLGRQVSELAMNMGVDLYLSVAIYKVPTESQARDWRYGTIQRIASLYQYKVVATAHNTNDRTETLIYNLFRGSGVAGLQSLNWKRQLHRVLSSICNCGQQRYRDMPSVRCFVTIQEYPDQLFCLPNSSEIAVIRPCLGITRTELALLALYFKLPVCFDSTNQDVSRERNYVRHHLLPFIRKRFSSRIDQALARWAEIVHAETLYLETLAQSICFRAQNAVQHKHNHIFRPRLSKVLVQALPLVLQRRVIKCFLEGPLWLAHIHEQTELEMFTSQNTISFDHVEQVRLACLTCPSHLKRHTSQVMARKQKTFKKVGASHHIVYPSYSDNSSIYTWICLPNNIALQLTSQGLVLHTLYNKPKSLMSLTKKKKTSDRK
uniref:tRNA(Ile)-lysidine synthase, chloroplastic n=1 Tax=Mesotaenium endlicherianum TaxID=184485 RepID=A0A024B479_9VIRI|nr:hypothetical protein RF62 [Mesotaenium endlicherianum]AHZ11162.1 hypothetical protein RF62 [Mesotaenium endlicherianum]